MNHWANQAVDEKEFLITEKEQNYFGPDLVLRRCRLVLRTNARAMTITNVQLLDCFIEAKKKLANFQMWCGAAVKGCTFKGQFVGNDFGNWPQQHPNGSIENCDFTNAVLDGCRFMGCDVDSIKLPKWPCFTIVHPYKLGSEIDSVEWPGRLRSWAVDLSNQPIITHGLVEYAPTLENQFGCTGMQLRELLQRLGNVVM